jgi:branched-chain amino acid transport system ATP-binding protein
MSKETMLEVKDVHTYYDTSHVLFGVSFEIKTGDSVCLLGRNGAGKSTTLLSIVGLTPPRSGSVKFLGEDITGKKPYLIARMGIGLVPQDRGIFPDLTVYENLIIGANNKEPGWKIEDIYELFPVLQKYKAKMGNALSGGEQQMLAIGRTLMTNPKLLLLDEPGEGLSPIVVADLAKALIKLKDKGVTILVAEHNLNFACKVSDRSYVIEKGQIRYSGTNEELTCNMEVKSKFLSV